MPKSSKQKLKYNTEYQSSPEQVKKRVMRNQARAEAIKKGLVQKGDNKEVDHVIPLDRGGTNAPSNLRVVEKGKNRAWRKGKSGYDA
jgi:5-methylcytosine-specific restriction endonuclease McrA